MNRDSLKRKVISGVLASSVALSLGITAFASNEAKTETGTEKAKVSTEAKSNKGQRPDRGDKKGGIQNIISKLVSEGKLTQEKADAIKAYMEKKREEFKGQKPAEPQAVGENKLKKPDMVQDLVDNGVISAEEAGVIKTGMEAEKTQMEADRYKKLQESGILTADEITKVKAYLEQKKSEREADFEAVKNMTEEERATYFEAHKPKKAELGSELVSEGIITQSQADKLKELMPRPERGPHGLGKEFKDKVGNQAKVQIQTEANK